MADDDLTNLIRERQRRADCEAAGIPYVPDEQAVRKAPHCDPEIPVVEDVLLEPNTAPAILITDRFLPPPLVIKSPEVTVLCADHGGGAGSATAAAAESLADLYLDDVAELTRSELYRTAENFDELQIAVDTHLEILISTGPSYEATFDAAIIAASTMEASAAAGVRVKAVELRGGPDTGSGATGLYALAELTALNRLVCTFYSEELWVVCDSGADNGFSSFDTEPVPLPDPARYRYRAAGFSSSTVSVEDANEIAELDAVSDPTFECVYVSEAFPVTCGADVDPVFDHTYAPAFVWEGSSYNTLEELGAAGFSSYALDSLNTERALVYSLTTPVGQFPSSSQAEANERAKAFTLQQLNCFFPSRGAEVNCANRSESNPVQAAVDFWLSENVGSSESEAWEAIFTEMDSDYAGSPESVTNQGLLPRSPGPGVEIDTSEGLVVQLPPGLVASLTNPSDAEAEARLHALGFLSCFWVAPATSCDCSDWYSEAQLETFNVTLNTATSSAPLSFEKGALGSSEDGPIPTSDVVDLCKASLTCIYCNKTKAPKCHIAYDAGGDTSDLWTPQDDTSLPIQVEDRAGVSTGATTGIPAGIVCDSDPRLPSVLASATSELPPPVVDGENAPVCLYGNDPHYAACDIANVPALVDLPAHSVRVAATGDTAYFSPRSTSGYIAIAAGVTLAPTRAEANTLARTMLLTQLDCFYESPALSIFCGAATTTATPPVGSFTNPAATPHQLPVETPPGFVASDMANRVSSKSKGYFSDVPLDPPNDAVSIAYGTTRSYVSPRAAFDSALLIGISQLDCFFLNKAQTEYCDLVVPENRIPADGSNMDATVAAEAAPASYVSQAAADEFARLMASSLLVCLYVNEEQTSLAECPQPDDFKIEATVDEGQVISPKSTTDANTVAQALAEALQICIPADAVGGGATGYPLRPRCPLCAEFHTEVDEDAELMDVSGGKVLGSGPISDLPISGEQDLPANVGANNDSTGAWHLVVTFSGGTPSTGNIIPGVLAGDLVSVNSDGEQTVARYEGSGKGCGHLRFVRGFHDGHLVWFIVT